MDESGLHIIPSSTIVVIPAYNERAILNTIIHSLLNKQYKVIVVDDGSNPSLQEQLQTSSIYYLRHKTNLGQGAALQTGFDYALSLHPKYIVSFDADGQHDINDIEALLEPLQKEVADITLGSRFLVRNTSKVPVSKKFILYLARVINFLFTGMLLSDAHNGLRAFTFTALQKIRITENRMAHASELLFEIKRNGLRYKEVPVTIHYSDYSKEKGQSAWQGIQIVFDLVLHKLFK
jgi:polyprenyl-phospho-N-acetylgalactosaminyl synthase